MDGKAFDELTRIAASGASRRATFGMIAGAALAAGLAQFDLIDAKKKGKGKGKGKNKKKKKCRKLNQGCGGKKKKCCKGLTCTDGACLNPQPPECDNDNDCGANEFCDDGVCVAEPPECVDDDDCGANEICQNGECVPEPECTENSDCGDNEICDSGSCICPAVVEDRCVIECGDTSDCPVGSPGCGGGCRFLIPDNGLRACVGDPVPLVCSNGTPCDNSDDCDSDEICVDAQCAAGDEGRCFPVCVG